jgi:hypothetical protein
MTFDELFTSYGIHPMFWPGMRALILAGARPDAELQVRIDYVSNYQDCLNDPRVAVARAEADEKTPACLPDEVIPFESIRIEE